MYSRILVALDGSADAVSGGEAAIHLAARLGCDLVATHIYDAGVHTGRFTEMEPVLPEQYQDEKYLDDLRQSHDSLISEGFASLSRGYMEDFLSRVRERGVPVSEVHREGRNYVRLLELAAEQKVQLLVMGATGLGRVGEETIGSTALRVLRKSSCDVLLVRAGASGGPVVVGIDGSPHALGALRRGVFWSRSLRVPLALAAAYDPAFHTHVFRTMAGALSQERQQEVGIAKQQVLHDQIIDDGLGKLYRTFLQEAGRRAEAMGMQAESTLVQGKASHALLEHAASLSASLIVVGRYGHHRQDISELGSNSEAVACLAPCNVLVTAVADEVERHEATVGTMQWDADALTRFGRIPGFAQPMARQAIERYVREQGRSRVTLEDFQTVAAQFGMGGSGE
jgi:nucleotide-binding universal stress UspA family protein